MRNRPTAIIAAGNRILVGVLRAIQQQNVAIPRDLSLIACDRSDVALLYPGPITLIDRPVEEIGRTAAQLLLERLGGQLRSSGATHLVSDPAYPRRIVHRTALRGRRRWLGAIV